MEFTANTRELRAAIKRAGDVAQGSAGLAALQHVHLAATASGLVVTGSDLATTVGTVVPAKVKTPGTALLSPAGILLHLDGDGETTVAVKGEDASVRAGKRRATVRGLDVAAYPERALSRGQTTSAIDAATLASALRVGLAAAGTPSKDATPRALDGVRLVASGDELTVVGTNGAALCHEVFEAPGVGRFALTIPTAAAAAFCAALPSAGRVRVGADEAGLSVDAETWWRSTVALAIPYTDVSAVLRLALERVGMTNENGASVGGGVRTGTEPLRRVVASAAALRSTLVLRVLGGAASVIAESPDGAGFDEEIAGGLGTTEAGFRPATIAAVLSVLGTEAEILVPGGKPFAAYVFDPERPRFTGLVTLMGERQ